MSEIKAELLGSFNNDLGVVNAAKVSFSKQSDTFDSGSHKGSHTRLVKYLANHNHFTCFTHSRETFILQPALRIDVLDEIDLAGMVFTDNEKKVRHSIWGWSNLINKGLLYPDCAAAINHYMLSKYPNVWPELVDTKEWNTEFSNESISTVSNESDIRFIDATFRTSVPIPIARQEFKHQVALTRNEESRRYVDYTPDVFMPNEWRSRPDGSIKQGSGNALSDTDQERVNDLYGDSVIKSVNTYNLMINTLNVAPEQARFVLPQGCIVSYIVTGSLSAYKRLCNQRLDGHAQLEIQQLAQQIDSQLSDRYGDIWVNR